MRKSWQEQLCPPTTAAERIRAALLRVEQKFDKLRRHAGRLEWNLKNAEALENFAGWAGLYFTSDRRSFRLIFPVGKNDARYVFDPAFTTRYNNKTNVLVLNGTATPLATVTLGETATGKMWDYTYYIGFFSTRRNARDFIKLMETEIENKK